MLAKRREIEEADLEITAFMNLMIVLVPVLLMSMVFSHISILKLNLPDLTGMVTPSAERDMHLEVVLRKSSFEVYFPSGVLVKTIDAKQTKDGEKLDYETLSLVLQEIKRRVKDKSDVLVLSRRMSAINAGIHHGYRKGIQDRCCCQCCRGCAVSEISRVMPPKRGGMNQSSIAQRIKITFLNPKLNLVS
jgi:biopolymer transport protein ExbD